MSKKFLQITIGISLIIFSSGFFIRSISRAEAAPGPEKFINQGAVDMGKYQMTMSECFNGQAAVVHVMVWDTETGKSKIYKRVGVEEWDVINNQLPASPLGN